MARTQKLRNWCVTSFDDDNFYVDLEEEPRVRYCVYQYEIAPDTGKRHIQCYIELKSGVTLSQLKSIVHDPSCHCEPRRGTRSQARAYCMKDESRDPNVDSYTEIGVWHPESGERARTDLKDARAAIQGKTSWSDVLNDDENSSTVARHLNWARQIYDARPVNIPVPDIELRTWQNEVIGLLDEPVEKRRIIWIWSSESGTGKTTMFDYCSAKYNILPGTDYANTLYAYDGHGVVWFDLSRHQTHDHIPYHALEKLSNQTVHLSTKYQTTRKYVSAHIVVTANIAPDENKIPNRCVKIYASLL